MTRTKGRHEGAGSGGGTEARAAVAAAIVLAIGTTVAMILLWPDGSRHADTSALGPSQEVYPARVESAADVRCAGAEEGSPGCRRVGFLLLEGPDADTTIELELFADSARVTGLDAGDEVLMGYQPTAPEGARYAFLDPDRRTMLVFLLGLFAAAVILLGGIRGAAALVGLGATVGVLMVFVIPAILDGRDPLAVSLVGATTIAFLALYLSHGFTTRTTIALLGTVGGLACTALLAVVFIALTGLTGFGSEEAFFVSAIGAGIDLRGLVLGGMVIGALGAIDDMTVTQASAVWELRAADPSMRRAGLLRSGMRIGRDHVASTVNTLVLAYAGASMPLLILFVLADQSVGTVANGEVLATEIVRTLVGSIGLVASVPITTWLAVRLAGGPPSMPGTEPGDGEDPPGELRLPRRRRDAIF